MISSFGFLPLNVINNRSNISELRANPDIDNILYIHAKTA
jgi:hypothetical protein